MTPNAKNQEFGGENKCAKRALITTTYTDRRVFSKIQSKLNALNIPHIVNIEII